MEIAEIAEEEPIVIVWVVGSWDLDSPVTGQMDSR